jgi:hypothetical protein
MKRFSLFPRALSRKTKIILPARPFYGSNPVEGKPKPAEFLGQPGGQKAFNQFSRRVAKPADSPVERLFGFRMIFPQFPPSPIFWKAVSISAI